MAQAKLILKAEDQLKGPLSQAKQELSQFEQFSQKVGNTLSKAFTLTAIITAVKKLGDAVADCVNAYKEQIEVDVKLDAILKATGQQYVINTRDAKEYARELQSVTRFGDDVIESTMSMLLATRKFDEEGLKRTIELSADLAEGLGMDLPSAASTLEKALVAPGEGLSRLKSIGITFTDAEEEMIKSLNEAGDALGAQQIILDKVEKSYGGIAESIASIDTSTLDKIKLVWGDLKEDLGDVFTNLLGPVFDWIYNTLRWLERLANQAAERSNFNKYVRTGNTQALADNFTEEFLKNELNLRTSASTEAYKSLEDNYWLNYYLQQFDMALEEFVRLSTDQRTNLLMKLSNNDATLTNMVNQQIVAYDEAQDELKKIVEALAIQHKDQLNWNKQFEVNQNAKIIEAAGGLGAIFSNAKLALFNPATVEGLTGNFLQTYLTGYFGSGFSDSAYMSIMNGELGMWLQTTDAFMIAMNNWTEVVEDLNEKYGKGSGTGGLFNLTINTPDWDLSGDELSMFNFGNSSLYGQGMKGSDTLSILGVKGASNLNIVPESVVELSENIKEILSQYGSRSETYQKDLLDEQIEQIENILNSLVDENTPLYTYLSEILKSLKSGRTGKTESVLTKLQGNLSSYFEAQGWGDSEQSKSAAAGVINTVSSSLGELGQIVSELASNMASMGPILGIIVTALKYVLQGFMEVMEDWMNEFLQYGLEPIREFGRVIANVLMPILESVMPSIQDSAEILIDLFNMIGTVLKPIAVLIGTILGPALSLITTILKEWIMPILKGIASVILVITSAFEWAAGWIRYAIAKIVNFFGGNMDDSRPGSYTDILQGHINELWGDSGSSTSYGTTGTTNASYQGATNITLNVYNYGNVVGENGLQEFAKVIRNELDNLAYYGR